MLVLSRKVGQQVILGDDATLSASITVLGIKGNTVRLGFTAPKEVSIVRQELTLTERRPRSSAAEAAAPRRRNGASQEADYMELMLDGLFSNGGSNDGSDHEHSEKGNGQAIGTVFAK